MLDSIDQHGACWQECQCSSEVAILLEFKIAAGALHLQGCGEGVFQRCEECAALGGLAFGSFVVCCFSPYAILKLERTYLPLVTIYSWRALDSLLDYAAVNVALRLKREVTLVGGRRT